MNTDTKNPSTIDEYLTRFPAGIRQVLQELRSVIKKAAPGAEETISYQMPTFRLHGNLVHFAAFKNHIGFYPTPSAIEAFMEEISDYTWAKGSVQFPLDRPLPLDLVQRIVVFRVKENTEKANRLRKK